MRSRTSSSDSMPSFRRRYPNTLGPALWIASFESGWRMMRWQQSGSPWIIRIPDFEAKGSTSSAPSTGLVSWTPRLGSTFHSPAAGVGAYSPADPRSDERSSTASTVTCASTDTTTEHCGNYLDGGAGPYGCRLRMGLVARQLCREVEWVQPEHNELEHDCARHTACHTACHILNSASAVSGRVGCP